MARNDSVATYLDTLVHARLAEIRHLRDAILAVDPGITERVKWNAPSFCWRGEDRVTMRLHPGDRVQLVFHRGAKAREAEGFAFHDPTGLIVWATADRGTLTVTDLVGQRVAIQDLVRRWMAATGDGQAPKAP